MYFMCIKINVDVFLQKKNENSLIDCDLLSNFSDLNTDFSNELLQLIVKLPLEEKIDVMEKIEQIQEFEESSQSIMKSYKKSQQKKIKSTFFSTRYILCNSKCSSK